MDQKKDFDKDGWMMSNYTWTWSWKFGEQELRTEEYQEKKTEGEAEKEILKIGGDDIVSATKICCFVAF